MNNFRTLFASALLMTGLTGIVTAQDGRPARRLESITWNPVEHKLTWVVVDGKVGDGNKFEGAKKTSYTIRMDEALMSFDGEDRRFSKTEAVSVHRLMDMVAKYAAESTVWWESGEGERVQRGGSNVDRKKEDPGAGDLDRLVPRRRTPVDADRNNKVIRISVEDIPAATQSQQIE
jgi:hypothetical protein